MGVLGTTRSAIPNFSPHPQKKDDHFGMWRESFLFRMGSEGNLISIFWYMGPHVVADRDYRPWRNRFQVVVVRARMVTTGSWLFWHLCTSLLIEFKKQPQKITKKIWSPCGINFALPYQTVFCINSNELVLGHRLLVAQVTGPTILINMSSIAVKLLVDNIQT